jgi:hypothetical protein
MMGGSGDPAAPGPAADVGGLVWVPVAIFGGGVAIGLAAGLLIGYLVGRAVGRTGGERRAVAAHGAGGGWPSTR